MYINKLYYITTNLLLRPWMNSQLKKGVFVLLKAHTSYLSSIYPLNYFMSVKEGDSNFFHILFKSTMHLKGQHNLVPNLHKISTKIILLINTDLLQKYSLKTYIMKNRHHSQFNEI